MQIHNLILTGFRATGKTLVGRLVAAQLHWIFLDTDELVRQRLGAPIAEVVARHGWPFFRTAERQLLRELTMTMRQTVLATGGGAIEHHQEWRELMRCALVVWLDAESDTIRQRLQDDPDSGHQRPSLTGQTVTDEIERLLEHRRPMYAAGSDLRISTEGRTPEQLAVEIVQKMHN
ncbi:MAG: shikimate kinase [Desulfobulbus sp.]|nr:shikimate kinase [Desulfobulbus sp.]